MNAGLSKAPPGGKVVAFPPEETTRFESTYVCILACNDGASIAGVVRQALSHCGHVIVCDDGSIDETSEEAQRAGGHVIRHPTTQGKGRSMSDLVNEVILRSPTGFVLLEREGYSHVAEILAVLGPILKDVADVAVGVSGMNEVSGVDAGVTAMNSKGLFTLYREGFFSEAGTSPQAATAAAAGLRVRAVSLSTGEAIAVTRQDRLLSSIREESVGLRARSPGVIDRDFILVGLPAIVFITAGLWLLAEFLVTYAYTGQIPIPTLVRGVIGLASILFGMGFMVSYAVAYYSKRGYQGTKP